MLMKKVFHPERKVVAGGAIYIFQPGIDEN
jgi:hypothetical protein